MSSAECRSTKRLMPVAENANSGRMKYALQGATARSMRSAGDSRRALAADRLRLAD